MKKYVFLGLFLINVVGAGYAQCNGVTAGKDAAIICGASTQLSGQALWDNWIDSIQSATLNAVSFVNNSQPYHLQYVGSSCKSVIVGAKQAGDQYK